MLVESFGIVLALLLLLLAAVLGAADSALAGSGTVWMRAQAARGVSRAVSVLAALDRRAAIPGAVPIARALLNCLAAGIATAVGSAVEGTLGAALALLATSFAAALLSAIPVLLAAIRPEMLALRLLPVALLTYQFAGPIAALAKVIAEALARAVALSPSRRRQTLALPGENQQSRAAAAARDEAAEDAAVEAEGERLMLRSVLELGEVTVAEIMTHRRAMVAVDGDAAPEDVVEQLLQGTYTRVPVFRGKPDNIVGILHARTVARALQEAVHVASRAGGRMPQPLLTRDELLGLAAKPWFVPDSTTLFDQLQAFRQRREHFAVVVDEYGDLMGIVTLEDVLEEIVGEIADELDPVVPGVRPTADGSYLVDGTVTIRDVNRELAWALPGDAANTIAGLVLYESRQIPAVGQVFSFHGFRFEVARRQRNQLTLLRVTPPGRTSAALGAPSATGGSGIAGHRAVT